MPGLSPFVTMPCRFENGHHSGDILAVSRIGLRAAGILLIVGRQRLTGQLIPADPSE
jgi:hypothetical protein